jgi:hypothetical protein
MTTLPLHAIPVLLHDQVYLRVYRGPRLELEMPLRPRQALVLAGQLLNLALAADHSAVSTDRRVLEAQAQDRVAEQLGHDNHGG